MDSEYNLPIKEVVVSTKDFTVKAGDQDVMWKPSPQCPKHWYILETTRGPRPYTIRLSACGRCVEEAGIADKVPTDSFIEVHSVNGNEYGKATYASMGEISDGYHTFNDLYRIRLLYNAAFFNLLAFDEDMNVHKSKLHSDGTEPFGGGWFIVQATLPEGQISQHYELKDWSLFKIDERRVADVWDGHTNKDVMDRIAAYIEHS